MKKTLKIAGIFVLIFTIVGIVVYAQSDPLPEGIEGKEADDFAKKMMAAVNSSAWDSTEIIKWSFGGRRKHVWDKKRHLAEVKWGKKRVLINLSTKDGLAYKDGELQEGEAKAKLLEDAWKAWVNDAFWLNPVVKCFDDGVSRKLIKMKDGSEALLVSYSSGGVTPGDSYLWEVGPDFKPVSWKMWVGIIPVKGIKVGWSDWKQTESGAWIAETHGGKAINLKISEVVSTKNIGDFFEGKDPFAEL
ncbi:MAG: hypothetical protein MRZ79_13500 [Bacteroidia bacterium]|nr:hypothetical protein [Bacteroidia bacterium]